MQGTKAFIKLNTSGMKNNLTAGLEFIRGVLYNAV
jgi:hypothetical protein